MMGLSAPQPWGWSVACHAAQSATVAATSTSLARTALFDSDKKVLSRVPGALFKGEASREATRGAWMPLDGSAWEVNGGTAACALIWENGIWYDHAARLCVIANVLVMHRSSV